MLFCLQFLCIFAGVKSVLLSSSVNGDVSLPFTCEYHCQSLSCVSDNNASICVTLTKSIVHPRLMTFTNVTNVSIKGPGMNSEILRCGDQASVAIVFFSSSNIHLRQLSINSCGAPVISEEAIGTHSAILFHSCKNITIESVRVTNSFGRALTLINTVGKVKLTHMSLENNVNVSNSSVTNSGGILVHLNESDETGNNASTVYYEVKNCYFFNNTARRMSDYNTGYLMYRGGGMLLMLLTNLSGVFLIEDNVFVKNQAYNGGGLHIYCTTSCYGHTINVTNTNFSGNVAECYGGGADLGYTSRHLPNVYPNNNNINFVGCEFRDNLAEYGGGVGI